MDFGYGEYERLLTRGAARLLASHLKEFFFSERGQENLASQTAGPTKSRLALRYAIPNNEFLHA